MGMAGVLPHLRLDRARQNIGPRGASGGPAGPTHPHGQPLLLGWGAHRVLRRPRGSICEWGEHIVPLEWEDAYCTKGLHPRIGLRLAHPRGEACRDVVLVCETAAGVLSTESF